jgi:hypothetical protein
MKCHQTAFSVTIGVDRLKDIEMGLEKYGGRCAVDSSNLRWGLLVGSCECSSELLCPIKCKVLLD